MSDSEFEIIELSGSGSGDDAANYCVTTPGDDAATFDLDSASATGALPAVLGEYQIRERIGFGGMGVVYRAEHRMMARTVALKTLPPDRANQPRAVDRFFAEVRAAARLLHPNVVTAFDAGSSGAIHYLVMEYVDGETLTERVAREGPLPVGEAIQIIRAVGDGLAHAHNAGLVHRDVKPGNIMLSQSGEIKVLDLGLAGFSSDQQTLLKKGKVVGTIEYMSPEQIEDPNQADARSDIYSLGGTLYYLLTGQSPYRGDLMAQVRSHRQADPPQVAGIRPDADLRIDHVLRRMMAKRPAERYQTIAELDADLMPLQQTGGSSHSSVNLIDAARQGDSPTAGQRPTTATNTSAVLGVDLGMFYCTAATAQPGGEVVPASLDDAGRASIRSAFACLGDRIAFGQEAWNQRTTNPESLAHCLQLYIGRSQVDRLIAGKKCPPEVLLALVLRYVAETAWDRKGRPAASAVTVPACYDQLHRRSIQLAASLAGLPGCRLVDRPLAAGYSQLMPDRAAAEPPRQVAIRYWLTVSVAGNGMEVCLLRHLGGRLQMLASNGAWSAGILAWQQRLVDLAAKDHQARFGIDPRKQLRNAASLQMGCETAIRALLLQPETQLKFRVGNQDFSLPVDREMFGAACSDLLKMLELLIADTVEQSGIDVSQIDRSLLIGSLARFPAVASLIRQSLKGAELIPIDQTSIACGAAGALADAFTEGLDPVQGCAARDIGILVWDAANATHRAATVIPRGTALPAKTKRRLRPSSSSRASTVTFVESADRDQKAWVALGSHKVGELLRAGRVEGSFTLDTSGLLHIGIGNQQDGGYQLPAMPNPSINDDDLEGWRRWVNAQFPQKTTKPAER